MRTKRDVEHFSLGGVEYELSKRKDILYKQFSETNMASKIFSGNTVT